MVFNKTQNDGDKQAPFYLHRLGALFSASDIVFLGAVALGLSIFFAANSTSTWRSLGGSYLIVELLFFAYGKFRQAAFR